MPTSDFELDFPVREGSADMSLSVSPVFIIGGEVREALSSLERGDSVSGVIIVLVEGKKVLPNLI